MDNMSEIKKQIIEMYSDSIMNGTDEQECYANCVWMASEYGENAVQWVKQLFTETDIEKLAELMDMIKK